MPRASRFVSYTRAECKCSRCTIRWRGRILCVYLFVLLTGFPIIAFIMCLFTVTARARSRRFFSLLRAAAARSSEVAIAGRRYLVVDFKNPIRGDPGSSSAVLLRMPPPGSSSYDDRSNLIPFPVSNVLWPKLFAEFGITWVDRHLLHLTEESVLAAAFHDQLDSGGGGGFGWWRKASAEDEQAPRRSRPLISALAALAEAKATSPAYIPLFSNARTPWVAEAGDKIPAGNCLRLQCEFDANMFLVDGGPWLSALLLRFDLAARRIQRAWREAISDPSRSPCRRRLADEARQMAEDMRGGLRFDASRGWPVSRR